MSFNCQKTCIAKTGLLLLICLVCNSINTLFVLQANAQSSPESNVDGADGGTPKVIYKPGQTLTVGTGGVDINPTDNLVLARQQQAAFPDNAEASFILAVALTRTSHVEEALKEVRRARNLAAAQGGSVYFDSMIARYEDGVKAYPNDNKVRYALAWAYYMKAYLLSDESRRQARAMQPPAPKPSKDAAMLMQGLSILSSLISNQPQKISGVPHLEGALERATPNAVPEIRKYYELSLQKLDELLIRSPHDIWAKAYRAYLGEEYTGNQQQAITVWQQCRKEDPNNPAAYFFLSDAYLKQGNLNEGLDNITKALQLRATGK